MLIAENSILIDWGKFYKMLIIMYAFISTLFTRVHYYPEFPKCNNNAAILIARFGQFDPKRYNIKEIFQFIMMAMEMISLENDHATVAGVCQIIDLKDISFKRIQNFDRCLFQKYWWWVQDCCPLRIKEVYVVNANKDIQRKFNFIKTFAKHQIKYPVSMKTKRC